MNEIAAGKDLSRSQWWANHPQERGWLLRDKYGWTVSQIDRTPFEQLSAEVLADVTRLAGGEPLAYVIGWVPFLELHIDLSEKPLIPRPETEYWVDRLRREWTGNVPANILDLCCGSGCIGLALAKFWPAAEVLASDVSTNAVRQTRKNAELLGIKNISAQVSDVFAQIGPKKFQIIATNPPYLNPLEMHPAELKFEPTQALYAVDQGMAIIEKILQQAGQYLAPEGQLWLECGEDQRTQIVSIAHTNGWTERLLIDQFGKFRGIIGTRA